MLDGPLSVAKDSTNVTLWTRLFLGSLRGVKQFDRTTRLLVDCLIGRARVHVSFHMGRNTAHAANNPSSFLGWCLDERHRIEQTDVALAALAFPM